MDELTWPAYVVFFLAYAASICAFSFNSIVYLRIFTAVSASFYVMYYYFFFESPLWLDIGTQSILILINVFMLALLAYRQKMVKFSEEEKEIYQGLFSRLSAFEFFKLVKTGHWKTFEKDEILLTKGEVAPSIYFIYNGEAKVILGNDRTVSLLDGAFIGEMSFSLSKPANADVVVAVPSRILYWNQEELKEFLERNPAMKGHFGNIITEDLAKKLNQ